MMFPSTLTSVLLWIVPYSLILKQMMDFQDMAEWLDEPSLFHGSPQKPSNEFLVFNDDPGIKATYGDDEKLEGQSTSFNITDFNDLLQDGWMDEKIDLSILDSTNDFITTSNVCGNLLIPDDALLESIINTDLFAEPFSLLSNSIEPADSSENIPGSSSPIQPSSDNVVSYASSPLGIDHQIPSSPPSPDLYYANSSIPSPLSNDGHTSDGASGNESNQMSPSYSNFDVVCIEIMPDVASTSNRVRSARKKSSGGKDMSLLQKSVKSNNHPYVIPKQLKKESRRERKKVQNKEAAARYRVKKREEGKVLSDEITVLEEEQTNLQDKHDKLKAEIKYLKSLMREMFKARGILK